MQLRPRALEVLLIEDPAIKAEQARQLQAALRSGTATLDTHAVIAAPPGLPGRPPRPRLVPPGELPRRSPFTPDGRAALLHAIVHIEFNAIKLNLMKASPASDCRT